MFCENCGKPLEEGDRFCQYCGAEVNQEENLESLETERTIDNNYDAGQDAPPAGTADEKAGSRTGSVKTPGSNTGSAGVIKWIAAAAAVVVIVVAAVVVTVLVRGKSEEVDQEVVSQQEDVQNATDDSETGEKNKTDGAVDAEDTSDSTESKVEGTPIPTIEPQDAEALEAKAQAEKEAAEQAERDAQEQAEKEAGEKAAGETQEETSGKTAGQTSEKSDEKQTSSETVEVYYGLTASTEDFIFPYSSTRVLTDDDLKILEADTVDEEHYWSQLAINEMLARYGYPFDPEKSQTSKDAYDQFTGLDWYEAAKPQCPYSSGTEVLADMNSVEKKNVSILNDWQKAHGCYY